MEEAIYDEEIFLDSGNLFSESVSNDKWVLYHGTNSIFEEGILAGGLRRHPISKGLVERFIRIYESTGMQLLAAHEFPELAEGGHGYVHLVSFTMQSFEKDFTTKPIYFSEGVKYALTYTNSRYSGGETVSGLQHGLDSLRLYCADEKYRDFIIKRIWDRWMYRHAHLLPAELARLRLERVTAKEIGQAHEILTGIGVITEVAPGNWGGYPTLSISTEELSEQIDELHTELIDYIEPSDNYQGGIVLAVKFEESDLGSFRIRHSGMNTGYGYDAEIPSGKIVGVCRLPNGYERNPRAEMKSQDNELARQEDPEDIVFRLRSMPATESPGS